MTDKSKQKNELNPYYIEDDYDEALAYKAMYPVVKKTLNMEDPNYTINMDTFDAIMKSL